MAHACSDGEVQEGRRDGRLLEEPWTRDKRAEPASPALSTIGMLAHGTASQPASTISRGWQVEMTIGRATAATPLPPPRGELALRSVSRRGTLPCASPMKVVSAIWRAVWVAGPREAQGWTCPLARIGRVFPREKRRPGSRDQYRRAANCCFDCCRQTQTKWKSNFGTITRLQPVCPRPQDVDQLLPTPSQHSRASRFPSRAHRQHHSAGHVVSLNESWPQTWRRRATASRL
jgi:hypothetical protein